MAEEVSILPARSIRSWLLRRDSLARGGEIGNNGRKQAGSDCDEDRHRERCSHRVTDWLVKSRMLLDGRAVERYGSNSERPTWIVVEA